MNGLETTPGAIVVAVGNQKGGVGKTTTAVHLAHALAERGHRTLVWDLDINAGATKHLGVEPDAFMGTYEVLAAGEDPLSVVLTGQEEGVELPADVHLIPSRRRLEQLDAALNERSKFIAKSEILHEPVRTLRGHYDIIILDTPPNTATAPAVAAYAVAHHFLLTAMPDPLAVAGLAEAVDDIAAARRHANPQLHLLGVLLGGVDSRTKLARQLVAYVDDAFGGNGSGDSRKLDTTLHRSTVVPQAQRLGTTVLAHAPDHKLADQFRALGAEVEDRLRSHQREVQGG